MTIATELQQARDNVCEINRVAQSEGWGIFFDCEIQRDDEQGVYPGDEAAIAHIRARAGEGSAIHRQAILLHDWQSQPQPTNHLKGD
jgi:hypothetical protein